MCRIDKTKYNTHEQPIAVAFFVCERTTHTLFGVNGLEMLYFLRTRSHLQKSYSRRNQNTVLYAENHLFRNQTGR